MKVARYQAHGGGVACVVQVEDKALHLCDKSGPAGCQAGTCLQGRVSRWILLEVAMDTGTALMMGPRRAARSLGLDLDGLCLQPMQVGELLGALGNCKQPRPWYHRGELYGK